MRPDSDGSKDLIREFSHFVDAPSLTPRRKTDEAVLRRAQTGGRPSLRAVVLKFSAIQGAAGMATLALCPQFGVGTASHNAFVHSLHAHAHPALYYLSCGVLFVLLGAFLIGIASNRRDLKALGRRKFAYFCGYTLGAYLVLLLAGTEPFLLVSTFWLLGGFGAQLIGFGIGRRLRLIST